MSTELIYCIFDNIPGSHPSWSVAVLAVNQSDARNYIRSFNGGGKLQQVIKGGGTVKAACGAVTEAAQEILRAKNERMMLE